MRTHVVRQLLIFGSSHRSRIRETAAPVALAAALTVGSTPALASEVAAREKRAPPRRSPAPAIHRRTGFFFIPHPRERNPGVGPAVEAFHARRAARARVHPRHGAVALWPPAVADRSVEAREEGRVASRERPSSERRRTRGSWRVGRTGSDCGADLDWSDWRSPDGLEPDGRWRSQLATCRIRCMWTCCACISGSIVSCRWTGGRVDPLPVGQHRASSAALCARRGPLAAAVGAPVEKMP